MEYKTSWVGSSETFQYDARGLVATRTIPIPTQTDAGASTVAGTFQYGYDRVGRNTTLTFPDGHQRIQVFDELGRLKSRCYQYTDGTPDHCYTAQYDKIGNPIVLTDPEMRQEIGYDSLDRVTSVSRFVPPGATNAAYVEHYAYNALGGFSINDGAIVDDRRPRLVGGGKASAGIPSSFAAQPVTLDGGGRVTSLNGQTFQYYAFSHTLQSLTTSTEKQTFTYDSLQRLSNIHKGPPSDQKPTYDFTNIYSDLSSSFAASVVSPHTTSSPPTPPDLPRTALNVGYDGVDHPLWMLRGRAVLYFELDTVGNVRRVHADLSAHDPQAGGELGGYSYTAFGKTIAASEPGGMPAFPINEGQPFGWQGKRQIAPNLYDSRARVWSADLGAFLQPDEYVYLSRGGTLWSWPGQNPFRWRDPSGRDASAIADWISRQDWIDKLAPALAEAGVASRVAPLVLAGEASLIAMEAINAIASLEAQRQSAAAIREVHE